MAAVIEADSQVRHNIWVPHLVDDFNFLDKVSNALPLSTFAAKAFDCDFGAHPLSLKDFSVATSAQEIRLVIELELVSFDVEVKAIPVESFNEKAVLLSVYFVFEDGRLIAFGFLV